MKKPSTTKRMIIMLALAFIVFGGIFGMKGIGTMMMNEFIDNMPAPPATISSGQAQTMVWENRLQAIGSLVPVNGADLTAELNGVVTAIHFESGQQVEKGARLLTLDDANERGELRRLQAQAELADINLRRRQRLFDLETIARSDLDMAISEANAAKAAVEAQAATVALKNIRAPFDGILGIRRVNVGQYLQAGTVIVTLQQLDPIDIDFTLPEQRSGRIEPGMAVNIRVDSHPDERFAGEVLAIEPRVDEATRSFRVRARIPNPDLTLRAGQFGRVDLTLPGERTVVVVPRTAINYSSYGESVFIVRDRDHADGVEKEVGQRFVQLGEARGDFIEVIEGLNEGDEVATSGLLKLTNAYPVTIDNENPPDAQLNPRPPRG
jgi:membrane fusion protein (multidrug efflux system)